MKKIIALFILFIVISACSKKEEENQKVKELELKVRELELQKQQAILAEKNRRLKAGAQKLENDKKRLEEEKEVQQSINYESSFYIVNIVAVKNENEAIKEVKKLENKGYKSDYLWIPDYASLSGAKFYSVYIGPFSTQRECEIATEQYRSINKNVYGLLVSQEKIRVQINGINKVKTTYY
ncbi:SPOR domain-containing protein [Empedobacter falsenii]